MILVCPSCGARSRLKTPAAASARVRCPQCRHVFAVVDMERESAPASGPMVLIVDDSPFFRELMGDLLDSIGCACRMAGTAAEAWALLTQEAVQLLILDLNLPDASGADFLRKLRDTPRFSSLPVLAISGVYRREQDASVVLRAGADDFLNKSFRPEEFTGRVKQLLGMS